MRYETSLWQKGNNTGIPVPDEVVAALGGGRRALVTVTVNGFTYPSAIGAMDGRSLIPFSAERRAATGLAGGDALTVDIELDTSPRTVDVPEDLAGALADAGVRAAFDALPPSARKAHVSNISAAKAADTRARRVAAVVAKLS